VKGGYINLARSVERRQAMHAQLQRLGLHWVHRVEAVDAQTLRPAPAAPVSAGERACFLSHAQAIAAADPQDFLLVLEDDLVLSDALPAVLRNEAMGQLARYDIVFLECQPYTSTANLLALWTALQRRLPGGTGARANISGVDILEAAGLYNWGATAYLVTPRGLRLIPGLLREALDAGPADPFDITLNRLIHAQRLHAAVLLPFLATAQLGGHARTTIADRPQAQANEVLGSALRRLFFAGPIDGTEAFAAAYRHAPLTDDPQLRLLADLMAQLFVITATGGAERR